MWPLILGVGAAAAVAYKLLTKPKVPVSAQPATPVVISAIPTAKNPAPTAVVVPFTPSGIGQPVNPNQDVAGPVQFIAQGTGQSIAPNQAVAITPVDPATGAPVNVVVTGKPQDTFLDPGSGLRDANFSDPAGVVVTTGN